MSGAVRSASYGAALIAVAVASISSALSQSRAGSAAGIAVPDVIINRTARLSRRMAPDLGRMQFEPAPVTVYRRSGVGRSLWSVQVMDDGGDYVGSMLWNTAGSELESAVWKPLLRRGDRRREITLRDARQFALIRLIQMDLSMPGARWSLTPGACKEAGCWIVWCRRPGAQYRVRLDSATGQLLSVDRRNG
jgi:hypothetical protein